MPKQVHIPKVGHVEFPDEMDDGAIGKAASQLHSNARNAEISQFMEQDPSLQGLPHSQKLKELASIAAMHEKYPRLAQAVEHGMVHVSATASQQPSAGPSNTAEASQASE